MPNSLLQCIHGNCIPERHCEPKGPKLSSPSFQRFKEQYSHPSVAAIVKSPSDGMAPPVGLSPTPQGNLESSPTMRLTPAVLRGRIIHIANQFSTGEDGISSISRLLNNGLAGQWTDADIAKSNRLHVPHTSLFLITPAAAVFPLVRWKFQR